jgi:hypothetical protein
MQARRRRASGLRGRGLTMKVVFALYLVLIAAGLAYFLVIGLMHA